MEGLTKRTFIFGGIVAALALAILFLPKRVTSGLTEAQMEDFAPMTVGNFQFSGSPQNPKQSYKMDEKTYRLLQPYGIVSRIYTDGNKSYDVILIAGHSKENFHDPRVCFTAQNWNITEDKEVTVETKERGTVPITIVKISQFSGGGKSSMAAFFYRGPTGFYPNTPNLGRAMLMGPLTWHFNTDAVFYRVMPISDNVNEEDLKDFVAKYLDAAKPTSNGFF
jgi:hypothetical protein